MIDLPHIERQGSGVPRLLLAGVPTEVARSQRLFDALAGGRPALLISALGNNAAPDDPALDWSDLLDWVISALDERGWTQVDVVGWSFGAAWAQQLLGRHPTRTRKAVLAATCHRFHARERDLLMMFADVLRSNANGDALRSGLLSMLFSPDFLRRPGHYATLKMHLSELAVCRERWADCFELLAHHDALEYLPTLSSVQTIIAADADWLVPVAAAREFASALPSARLEILASGHAAWIEALGGFARAVEAALGND